MYSVLFMAAVAALGTAFTDTSSNWYQSLIIPALQPPGIVFTIVWTILYILIASSLSIVSINPKSAKKTLLLFASNGVLNVLWTYTFFYLQKPASAVFVMILIVITAAFLFAETYRVDKTAAYLLIPYLIWLCFAMYLNYEIAFLN